MNMRIGQGVDVHQWELDRTLRLGGVVIPHHSGLKGHSDGDALLHAIIDALCGAVGKGDIGEFFPDTDSKWKDADSRGLFREIVEMIRKDGWEIVNIDSTVVTEEPKLSPYKEEIRASIAELSRVDSHCIGVKATTCEKLGFLGRGEGLGALAVVLLKRRVEDDAS